MEKIFGGPYDCAPRALLMLMPDLDAGAVRSAFMVCCANWPHAGVTNKELNIVISHMKIAHRLEYQHKSGLLGDFFADRSGAYILLIDHHFTVSDRGRLRDEKMPESQNLYEEEEVHCWWRLIGGV